MIRSELPSGDQARLLLLESRPYLKLHQLVFLQRGHREPTVRRGQCDSPARPDSACRTEHALDLVLDVRHGKGAERGAARADFRLDLRLGSSYLI